jgi:hypothetical protein
MSEQHDHDKLKQEEADEQLQHEENELFKSIEPYIDGLNNAIKFHAHCYGMSREECAKYVRETVLNLIEG